MSSITRSAAFPCTTKLNALTTRSFPSKPSNHRRVTVSGRDLREPGIELIEES